MGQGELCRTPRIVLSCTRAVASCHRRQDCVAYSAHQLTEALQCSVLELVSRQGSEWKIRSENQQKEWKIHSENQH